MNQTTVYKLIFISNYINHHQIPFCNSMHRLLEGKFLFIQTEPMEQERVRMGWQENIEYPYLKRYYEEPEQCRKWIAECEVAVFGGTDEESYIEERLRSGRPILRYSERLYKTGQWKAVSPRGLVKKYHDHTKYRKASVYLLCAGAYVPSDFHIVRAYPGKMFCWGYFPETKHYDIERLMEGKGRMQDGKKVPYLLWAARLIDWKHPELPLRAAAYLKEKELAFHLDMVGGGMLEPEVKELVQSLKLEDCVTLVGYQTPSQVRRRMEEADIYLLTSDRQEGWGAVANEAMNSGCALVCDHMVGAAPYLVRQGYNGYLYEDGDDRMLFETVEKLVKDEGLCSDLGRHAYDTIVNVWNAENAAQNLLELIQKTVLQKQSCFSKKNSDMEEKQQLQQDHTPKECGTQQEHGQNGLGCIYPGAPAPVIPERKMWRKLNGS